MGLPVFAMALVLLLGYAVSIAVYRLYLSPLAKFPGPKLAGLTKWYEAYHEIFLNGQFTFHIEDLHRKYGPIVRITPQEIHIQDPSYWDTLYVKHGKSSKYEWMAGRFGNSGSLFTTSDPNLHKIRRAPLNGMFSRRAILGFEPVVQEKLHILSDGLEEFEKSGKACKISEAFSAFASDVVTEYAFGFSYNHLGAKDFSESFHDAFMAVSAFGHIALQFPIMHPVGDLTIAVESTNNILIAVQILNSLPDSWNTAMNPPLSKLLDLQKDLRKKVQSVREEVDQGWKPPRHPTLFHTVFESDMPESQKSDVRMAEEAQLFLGAGIETTAWALSVGTFHILNQPVVQANLKAELREALPDISQLDAFAYAKLEMLPYLRACIKESIRLSLGVSSRNPRVFDESVQWREWVIPPGTPISMTIKDVQYNDECFPRASEFRPERWLGDAPRAPDGSSIDRYFVSFGKGSRTCIGINLAYMELFLIYAHLFRKYKLKLYGTDVTDVTLAHDFFLPSPKLDSQGVRVKVVGRED